jgi:hypothetical protein
MVSYYLFSLLNFCPMTSYFYPPFTIPIRPLRTRTPCRRATTNPTRRRTATRRRRTVLPRRRPRAPHPLAVDTTLPHPARWFPWRQHPEVTTTTPCLDQNVARLVHLSFWRYFCLIASSVTICNLFKSFI